MAIFGSTWLDPQDEDKNENCVFNAEKISQQIEKLEYAKKIAIDFAKFVNAHTLQDINNDNSWCYEKSYGNYETVSDEQLFNLYLQLLNKK